MSNGWGKFEGEVVAKWLRHSTRPDRDMKLTENFAYVDPNSVPWEAPSGSIINGASIPRVFWAKIGPPYVGNYRRASVLHDVACDARNRPHEQVHRMFYDAMRCDKVPPAKAHLMYQAVKNFGPRWDDQGQITRLSADAAMAADPDELETAVLVAFGDLGDVEPDAMSARVDEILGHMRVA